MKYSGLVIGGPKAGQKLTCEGPKMRCAVHEPAGLHYVGVDTGPVRIQTVVYEWSPLRFDTGQQSGNWILEGTSAYEAYEEMQRVYANAVVPDRT